MYVVNIFITEASTMKFSVRCLNRDYIVVLVNMILVGIKDKLLEWLVVLGRQRRLDHLLFILVYICILNKINDNLFCVQCKLVKFI